MTSYKRIAVLLGGRSAERDVSLSSGAGCAKAMAKGQSAPIYVHLLDRNVQLTNAGQRLAGEDLVEFDDVDVSHGQPSSIKGLQRRRYCPHPREVRRTARHRDRTDVRDDACAVFGRAAVLGDENHGGAIGRRYRRQDEVGTPFCITVDGETLQNQSVTIRDRDSAQQRRVQIGDVAKEIRQALRSE